MSSRRMTTLKIGLAAFVLLIVIGLLFPTWTPKVKGENGISLLQQIELNGAFHEVMIRGEDRSNPVILFVHGGPGCSEIPYVHKYQDLLEKHFTIVHYDQRGSGKSYHFFEDYSNLSSDLLVDDLLALTDYVKRELEQDKVILIGHSFGTYIGMKAAAKSPERFAAYIGIGQVADQISSEIDSLNYTLEQAELAGNLKDVEQLKQLRASIERGEQLTPRSMVRKYGGAARLINENWDYYKGFLISPEYNLLDVIRYVSGVSLSQDILLKEGASRSLPDLVNRLEIPVYYVMGQYDYMTSVRAARAYYEQLEAPVKEFVVFEQSAHYLQFEEEALFYKWLQETWNELK